MFYWGNTPELSCFWGQVRSSTYFNVVRASSVAASLTKVTNPRGPIRVPCGTPPLSFTHLLLCPLYLTHCSLPSRKFAIHVITDGHTPRLMNLWEGFIGRCVGGCVCVCVCFFFVFVCLFCFVFLVLFFCLFFWVPWLHQTNVSLLVFSFKVKMSDQIWSFKENQKRVWLHC